MVSYKIEREAVWVDKEKKKMKIIDDDRFAKVVNMQRTPSPTPGITPQTLIQKTMIVELVLDWDELEAMKKKLMIVKEEPDG